jgi:hypothetical protein
VVLCGRESVQNFFCLFIYVYKESIAQSHFRFIAISFLVAFSGHAFVCYAFMWRSVLRERSYLFLD